MPYVNELASTRRQWGAPPSSAPLIVGWETGEDRARRTESDGSDRLLMSRAAFVGLIAEDPSIADKWISWKSTPTTMTVEELQDFQEQAKRRELIHFDGLLGWIQHPDNNTNPTGSG